MAPRGLLDSKAQSASHSRDRVSASALNRQGPAKRHYNLSAATSFMLLLLERQIRASNRISSIFFQPTRYNYPLFFLFRMQKGMKVQIPRTDVPVSAAFQNHDRLFCLLYPVAQNYRLSRAPGQAKRLWLSMQPPNKKTVTFPMILRVKIWRPKTARILLARYVDAICSLHLLRVWPTIRINYWAHHVY